jgi:hypothetical protein
MAALLEIGVTAGVPDSGTGEVMTINEIAARLGEVTDTPADHTLLRRLDLIESYLVGIDGKLIDTNTKLDTLEISVDAVTSAINTNAALELPAGDENLGYIGGVQMETVAASQTDQMMGGAGAVGDYISHILVVPATTSPGAISIEDGATNTTVFTGGASSVSNLIPFAIPLGSKSTAGGWEITTGLNVSCLVYGKFTA